MFLRQTENFVTLSMISQQTVDVSTYDRVGREGADFEARVTAANETPSFVFTNDVTIGDPTVVAFLGMGRAKARLSGNGNYGDRISSGAGGLMVQGTVCAANAEGDHDDFAICVDPRGWVDGQETEIMFIRNPI